MGPSELNNRRDRNGQKRSIVQIAIGLIVVFLGGTGSYVWNLHADMHADMQSKLNAFSTDMAKDFVLMAVHRSDLDKLYNFMVKGERYTLERGKEAEQDILKSAKDLKELRAVVGVMGIKIARMPLSLVFPFTPKMQQRLANAEKDIAIINQRIDELNRKLNIEN